MRFSHQSQVEMIAIGIETPDQIDVFKKGMAGHVCSRLLWSSWDRLVFRSPIQHCIVGACCAPRVPQHLLCITALPCIAVA